MNILCRCNCIAFLAFALIIMSSYSFIEIETLMRKYLVRRDRTSLDNQLVQWSRTGHGYSSWEASQDWHYTDCWCPRKTLQSNIRLAVSCQLH